MSVIGSDGLSLLVGDGGTMESFSALKGATVSRFEINHRSHVTNAVAADAWQTQAGTSGRFILLECEAYATDEAASLRLRTLAMAGALGNFKLQLRSAEIVEFSAYIAQYRELMGAGEIKKIQCRLESTGTALLA